MIFDLLYPLSTQFGWASVLNVLRYVPFRIIMATITAMALCFFLAPWFIRELQKKQIGQVVRGDGPESHRVKAGTPTMGGALILLSVLMPTVLWADVHNALVVATMAVTTGYGLIGYIDDRLKIEGKNSRGLPGRYKLLGQTAIGTAGILYAFKFADKLSPEWLAIRGKLAL
ncbi:MAG TPA: phospho-N-acetylmuramoyl-pentapeptide-transferase, partial [Polyangiaceae bacterium]|nr:phospho-N-acetylmuramoyl-pentapeptide-transferase [Polyangiaceae bacterium]